MKSIGIVTLPLRTNYGGVLQAFALKTILENRGNSVIFIEPQINHRGVFKHLFSLFLSHFSFLFTCNHFLNNKVSDKLYAVNFTIFFDKYFNKNRVSLADAKSMKNEFSAIIVGSDQVWRNWGKTWDIGYYFLGFASEWNIKKIGYSVSLGVGDWSFSEDETSQLQNLVKQFDKISVRETNAVNICRENLHIEPKICLDPTLLLSKDDYQRIFCLTSVQRYPLVSYILDPDADKLRILNYISTKKGNIPITPSEGATGKNCIVKPLNSIENWLQSLLSADFIITDSFHGTAFAINFNKPFIVLSNQSRGQARLESILSVFGLQDRFITNEFEVDKCLSSDIDWIFVNSVLKEKKEYSFRYLEQYVICHHTSL